MKTYPVGKELKLEWMKQTFPGIERKLGEQGYIFQGNVVVYGCHNWRGSG